MNRQAHTITRRLAAFRRIVLLVAFLTANAFAQAAAPVNLPAGLLHPITTESLTADGQFVATRLPDGQVLLCDAATRKPVANIRPADGRPTALAVAPDGKSIAIPSRILGRDGAELVRFTLGGKGEVRSLAYSPDGRYVAAGREDGRVCLLSTTTGREVLLLAGYKDAVSALAYSPDARLLAAVGVDGTLRLWELASGVEVWHVADAAPGGRLAFDTASRVLFQADAAECAVTGRDVATGKEISRRTMSGLTLEPAELILAKGAKKTPRVVAKWSDRIEEVTRQCVFEIADGDAATVAPGGVVRANHPGRCVVAARFFGRTVAANVFVPFAALDKPIAFEPHNFIDEIALARWKKLNVAPAGIAPDHVFLRRAYLTLIGRPPTPDEVRAFVKDTDAKKRVKLIDALLDRCEYADYWSEQWVTLLDANSEIGERRGPDSFRKWMRKALADNRPLDRMARDLITTYGRADASGGAPVGLIGPRPQVTAEVAAQTFLGIDLRCASCHEAPGEAWGHDAEGGLTAVFVHVSRDRFKWPTFDPWPSLTIDPWAKIKSPTGKTVAPRLPGEPLLKLDGSEDPRAAFARWLTAKDNRVLARTFVNRYWAALFGRGLRDPVEGARAANIPIYPELLDALTEDFVKSGYDVKHLLRTMATSRLFEMDNKQPVADATDVLLARHVPRHIPDGVMQRCFKQAVGVPAEVPLSGDAEAFRRLSSDDLSRCAYADAQGGRVLAFVPLPGSDMKPFTDPKGTVAHLLKSKGTDAAILEELFLLTLSRTPAEKEKKAALDHLGKGGATGRKEALVDILWALTNSKEFLLIP